MLAPVEYHDFSIHLIVLINRVYSSFFIGIIEYGKKCKKMKIYNFTSSVLDCTQLNSALSRTGLRLTLCCPFDSVLRAVRKAFSLAQCGPSQGSILTLRCPGQRQVNYKH